MNKFIEWLIDPFLEKKEIIPESYSPPYTFNKKIGIFRPQYFDEYIGQNNAKILLKGYMEGFKRLNRIYPHTLISGYAGYGKSTLAKIIANELSDLYQYPFNFIYKIASNITENTDITALVNICNGGILFIDEIHSLERSIAERMYSLMEDFRNTTPFTLIGATTELGELLENRKPFVDRFGIIIELDPYNFEELAKLASQYKNRVFTKENNITNQTYITLVNNCRGTPRTLIRLLEATICFEGNTKKTLKSFGIITDGYTLRDYRILKYIASSEKGTGLNSISNYLGTSATNYLYQIEPFLLQNDLIIRMPRGRKITENGLLKLKELDKKRL